MTERGGIWRGSVYKGIECTLRRIPPDRAHDAVPTRP